MSDDSWSIQKKFYERILDQYQLDAKVKGIIVFTHEPPYTNSPLIGVSGGDDEVREDLLPKFCSNAKTVAFISAHAHGYERFTNQDCP